MNCAFPFIRLGGASTFILSGYPIWAGGKSNMRPYGVECGRRRKSVIGEGRLVTTASKTRQRDCTIDTRRLVRSDDLTAASRGSSWHKQQVRSYSWTKLML